MKRIIKPAYKNWDDNAFQRYVDQFELPLNKYMKTFSKGMKMKASLAIALAHHAELIIMDEPTAGLDPIFRRELLNILHELMQDEDKTIFFSTHITTDLDRIADYITFVHNGEHIFTKEFYKIEEEYAIVKGTLNLLDQETEREFVAIRKSNIGFEALTADKNRMANIFGDSVIVENQRLKILCTIRKKDGDCMANLIFKDILIQKKMIVLYIATIILYLLINVSLVKIGFLYSLAIITMSFSYDEKIMLIFYLIRYHIRESKLLVRDI